MLGPGDWIVTGVAVRSYPKNPQPEAPCEDFKSRDQAFNRFYAMSTLRDYYLPYLVLRASGA